MRKPLVIILLLLIVSAGFVGYGAAEIYKTNNQVEITEEIIFGDSQAADGLETTFRTTYADHSFWTTTQTVGSDRPPETEYEFSRKAQPMKYRYNNYGINYYLNYLPDSFFYDYEEDPEGLPRAYKELFDELAAGEEREKTVRLADYVDYYPLEANFILENASFSLHSDYSGSTYDHYFSGNGGHEEAIKVFNDYFKIPVLEDEWVSIHASKTLDGSFAGHGMNALYGGNLYEPATLIALGYDRCFFTIASHSTQGQQMDMSLLPDGYGIFSFDYERYHYGSDLSRRPLVYTDTFRNAYPLDPSVRVCSLLLNEDQSLLYLFTMEEGYYWFTAIDTGTMEASTRMKVAPLSPKDPYGPSVYDCDDFICMNMGSINKIAVISVSSDAKFTLEFVADTIIDGEHSMPSFPEPVFAFDGKQLVAGLSGFTGYEQANYDLIVFTADGPQYWGHYKTSLMTGRHTKNTYRYDVKPLDYDSLSLKWAG